MLHPGRTNVNEAESAAIDKLIEDNEGQVRSYTRTEPDESGPIHVTVGDELYEVAEDGTTTKVTDG